jgi:hypothetical protein
MIFYPKSQIICDNLDVISFLSSIFNFALFNIPLEITNKRGQANNSSKSIICLSPFFFLYLYQN